MFVFLGLRQLGLPPAVSVGGSFAATALVFLLSREQKLLGAMSLVGFVVVSFSAGLGIILGSEKAYLAAGPASDYLMVTILLGSVMIGQPLVGGLACELFPGIAGKLSATDRVFVVLSLVWAGFNIVQGSARWYLLSNMSPGEYTVWTKVLNYPLSATLFGLTAWAIIRAARELDPDLGPTHRVLLRLVHSKGKRHTPAPELSPSSS